MKFKTEILRELRWCSFDDYEFIEDEQYDSNRWSEMRAMVFSWNGKLYSLDYETGLTEMQDHSSFDDAGDEMECTEVESYEETVTTTKYRAVKS